MTKQFFLALSLLTFLFTVSQAQYLITPSGYKVSIDGDLKNFKATLKTEAVDKNLDLITVTLRSAVADVPLKFFLRFEQPATDIQAHWHPAALFNKIGLYGWQRANGRGYFSGATNNAPVFSLYNQNGINRLTFAVSEIMNPVYLNAAINERSVNFDCSVELFSTYYKPETEVKVVLRIDSRPIALTHSINEVQEWWQTQNGFKAAEVPDAAKKALYSTWYSFHQAVNQEELETELKLAREMGCEVVITDDGWQTDLLPDGNDYYGDWEPSKLKFPDLKNHVQRVKAMGFKYMMWVAVPFVGTKSNTYKKFEGKYLCYTDWARSYVLDPRFPEVRQHIIETFANLVTTYDLDGLKLDFIDRFNSFEADHKGGGEGRDYQSVEEAADRLMTDLLARLYQIKPDFLAEFRQYYTGPLMRKYGNMLRAHDCANAAIENRIRTIDTRLISGKTAVHADMLVWNASEPASSAALQIQNVFFSVPQFSMKPTQLPADHLKMSRFQLAFWNLHKDVLLDGELIPLNPEAYYPVVKARTSEKEIIALYTPSTVATFDSNHPFMAVVNANTGNRVTLSLPESRAKRTLSIYDCTGTILSRKVVKMGGVQNLEVPPAGIVTIENQMRKK